MQGAGAEGSCVVAITTQALARANGWPVMALLALDQPEEGAMTVRPPSSDAAKRLPMEHAFPWQPNRISGVAELALAIDAARSGRIAAFRWRPRQPTTPEGALGSALQGREQGSAQVAASDP
jgi:hypothetical protein